MSSLESEDVVEGYCPAIRVLMMPRDTNAWGTIFGGVILSYIDQAAAVIAHEYGCPRVVTAAMDKVEFHQPVHVGDVVSFFGRVVGTGRTSLTVKVIVEAERQLLECEKVLVTEAVVTFVRVDEHGRPIQISRADD
jgi:acyl-CoA thioesterase YciA